MRKTRILKEGFSYHVIARINRQELLFEPDSVKELFMGILRRAKKKYRFTIKNFCIMGNHIHFILKPLCGENLSKIMQWILGVFASKYNKLMGLKGHVWYDRFKSILIESFRQYFNTFMYIVRNPVKAGLSDSAFSYKYCGMSSIGKGELDVMERPPNKMIKKIWREMIKKQN